MLTLWRAARSSRSISNTSTTTLQAANPERLRLLEQIIELNPSATREFLDTFNDSALGIYLDHLRAVQIPRGRQARWVRPGDSPAIVCRERLD